MSIFEEIKSMDIDDTAKMLFQGINCVAYGSVDCEECFNRYKLCFYRIKDMDETKIKKLLEQD